MKRPENTSCLRPLGKAKEEKKNKPENKDKNAASFSWKHSYTQTARPCVPPALTPCTWRSVTYSRLGKEQHEEGARRGGSSKPSCDPPGHRPSHGPSVLGRFWGKEEVLVVWRQEKG